MLQYGHEIRDYNKNVLGSRSSVLRQVTQNLMAQSMDDCPRRNREDTGRRRTVDGSECSSRSRSFTDHVAAVMQPQRSGNVYVVVDAEGSARVESLQAVMGVSTVGHLIDGMSGVCASQVRVNGLPITSTSHPLYMGDVVSVVENVPPVLRLPMIKALADAPAALGFLQRELYGIVLTNMGRPCAHSGRDAAAA